MYKVVKKERAIQIGKLTFPTNSLEISQKGDTVTLSGEKGEILSARYDEFTDENNIPYPSITILLQDLRVGAFSKRRRTSFDPTFIIEIDTEQSGVSNNDQFQFTGAVGEYDVDAVQGGTVVATFAGLVNEETITLPAPGVYELHIKLGNGKFFDKFGFDDGGDRLKLLRTLQWGDYGVNEDDQNGAFRGSVNHTKIAGEGKWFEVVVIGDRMFAANDFSSLPEGIDFPNLIEADSMLPNIGLAELPQSLKLDKLENGRVMFQDNNFTSLPEGMTLPLLSNGELMFRFCNSLTSIPEGMTLPLLANGRDMFRATSLTSLPEGMTLPLLENGSRMLQDNNLTSLPEEMYLPSLTNGSNMFAGNTLSTESLSRLYCAMSEKNPNSSVTFHGGNGNYDPSLNFVIDGVTVNTGDARADLVNRGWSITDGGALIVIQPFDEGDWSMNNDEGTIELIIDELPTVNVGGAITDIEYRVNGGNPISLGENTTGTYIITGVQEEDDIEIRAINDVSGSPWSDVKEVPSEFSPIQATGGDSVFDITQAGVDYRVHVFEGSDDFVVTDVGDQGKVEALVVAGGGGGGRFAAGGGGAGGLLFDTLNVSVGSLSVVVGSGGAGLASGSGQGQDGNNSKFETLEAIGGGAGGGGRGTDDPLIWRGKSGGSGGGNGSQETTVYGFGTTGQGNDGGAGSGSSQGAGGGGGAGEKGQDGPSNNKGGDGGDGLDFSDEFGTTLGDDGWFAGGGGSSNNIGFQSSAGKGGGGEGFPNVQNGQTNTGGGGGGQGGNGGSGITIIRYPLNQPI